MTTEEQEAKLTKQLLGVIEASGVDGPSGLIALGLASLAYIENKAPEPKAVVIESYVVGLRLNWAQAHEDLS